jgi:hypothetical protein
LWRHFRQNIGFEGTPGDNSSVFNSGEREKKQSCRERKNVEIKFSSFLSTDQRQTRNLGEMTHWTIEPKTEARKSSRICFEHRGGRFHQR